MAQNPANARTVCISRIRELNFNTAYKSHKSLAGVFMFLQFPRLGIHASPGLEQRQFLCGCRRQHPRFSSTTSPPQPTSRSMIRTLWVQLVPSSTGSTTMVRLWASSQTPTVCRWLGWHSNYTRAGVIALVAHRPAQACRDAPPHHQTALFRSKLKQSRSNRQFHGRLHRSLPMP